MKNILFFPLFWIVVAGLWSCEKQPGEKVFEEPDVTLSADPLTLSFKAEGGTKTIAVSSNTTWTVSYDADSWFYTSLHTVKGDANLTLYVEQNTLTEERSGSLTISTDGADDITVSFTQEAATEEDPEEPVLIADWIEPDHTGMESDALTLASKIRMGWNLGNTLEAIGGETAWGNPRTSNDLILSVKNAGFNGVRLPCAWNQYLENQTTYKIKDSWLARVKEVIDYCVNNDMYVVLNIHWDGGWLENNCTVDKQVEVNAKQDSIWKQIAKYFRDYDEHLLFSGANEPNVENQEQANVLKVYMQTFVNAVRATGGRNTYRNLIIPGPSTDIDKTNQFMSLPDDPTPSRMMAEVHYYSPYQFCLMSEDANWGKMYYFWGAEYHLSDAAGRYPDWDCEEDYVKSQFGKMKTKFVDNGIPVILGEYAAIWRDLSYNTVWQEKHNESRVYFLRYVTEQAKNYGLVPFYWDPGTPANMSSGVFNRYTDTVGDQPAYDGLMAGAQNGTYPY
ncbi:cellulase family glycosylhydrolase [Saccharicrinis sp. FJH54]|uniref:cellulase family glycosylhydrolase n=1 Tax=Saccharicrinis sp. FJH54 TaxID=3344665 RepID=UPI0035D43998